MICSFPLNVHVFLKCWVNETLNRGRQKRCLSLLPLDVAPWRSHMLCFYLAPCRRGSTPQQGWRGSGSALWDRWSCHKPHAHVCTDKSHRALGTRRPRRTWSDHDTHTGPAYLKQHRRITVSLVFFIVQNQTHLATCKLWDKSSISETLSSVYKNHYILFKPS